MIIKYAPAFIEKLKKVDVRILKSFKQQILVFSKDPHESQLNTHALKREYKGLRSINATADYRAIYKEKQDGEEVVAYFIKLGTHKELYG